jgi:hypothetical protein
MKIHTPANIYAGWFRPASKCGCALSQHTQIVGCAEGCGQARLRRWCCACVVTEHADLSVVG